MDFLYPVWYDLLGIEQTIAFYGPQNRHHDYFETTSKEERIRLFSAIVTAVHRGGQGLDKLRYHDRQGRPIALLLTPPEIVHLQDVSRIVAVARQAGWSAVIIWLALTGVLKIKAIPLPALRTLFCSVAVSSAALTVVVLWLGPLRIFYALHRWVFPPEHPWFFYYQDSLMTTLMKAPDLFAYIALALAALSLFLLLAFLWIARRLLGRVEGR